MDFLYSGDEPLTQSSLHDRSSPDAKTQILPVPDCLSSASLPQGP
jgi:hypothetical protein